MREQHDVVVVGAGQAGLAMSALLQRHGLDHVLLERARVAERWRTERWDSLRFQFPNWSLSLPGYRYTGDDPDGFASHQEVLALLEEYAAAVRAPVREHTEVLRLAEDGGGFTLTLATGALRARRVVVATGPFQRPRVPDLARGLPPSVLQLDATRYRAPSGLPPGAVLVVGSGASGTQIAEELLDAGRRVYLSVSAHKRVPRRYRGQDVYWWLDRLGRFAQTVDALPGGHPPPSTVVTGVGGGHDVDVRELAARGLTVLGRVLDVRDGVLALSPDAEQTLERADEAYAQFLAAARAWAAAAGDEELAEEEPGPQPARVRVPATTSLDLEAADVGTVVWATGYTDDYGWLSAPVLDVHGRPVQRRGVSPVPGLFFLGRHWMHTFGSGLLSGVGTDAAFLAEQMARGN